MHGKDHVHESHKSATEGRLNRRPLVQLRGAKSGLIFSANPGLFPRPTEVDHAEQAELQVEESQDEWVKPSTRYHQALGAAE